MEHQEELEKFGKEEPFPYVVLTRKLWNSSFFSLNYF